MVIVSDYFPLNFTSLCKMLFLHTRASLTLPIGLPPSCPRPPTGGLGHPHGETLTLFPDPLSCPWCRKIIFRLALLLYAKRFFCTMGNAF